MTYAVTFPDNHILRGRQVVVKAEDEWQASRRLAQNPGLKDGKRPVKFDPKKHTAPMKSSWITEEKFEECKALILKHMEAE